MYLKNWFVTLVPLLSFKKLQILFVYFQNCFVCENASGWSLHSITLTDLFHLLFLRGLVGYRSVFSSDTRGTGFMHRAFLSIYIFLTWNDLIPPFWLPHVNIYISNPCFSFPEYEKHRGPLGNVRKGVLVCRQLQLYFWWPETNYPHPVHLIWTLERIIRQNLFKLS